MNCHHSFATKKIQTRKKVCKTDFSNVIMPSKDIKILEFNQYQKSDKTRFIIYSDLECLIKMIDGCKDNAENLSTAKIDKHIPNIFHQVLQCLQYCHLQAQKISMLYIEAKIV